MTNTSPDPSTASTQVISGVRGRRPLTYALTAIVVVLGLILAGGIYLVTKARSGDINIPGITLTAADDRGIDPFTESVALGAPSDLTNVRLSAQVGLPDQGTVLVNGNQPGLYATTGAPIADGNALRTQLTKDPAKSKAWAGVFGIDSPAIPYYLDTLIPVLLTADTWVTDHGYSDGAARPHQAVLQRGTVVLVDAAGVPRVRCASGSPLTPPADAPIGGYRVGGKGWSGYDTREVTKIVYGDRHVATVDGKPKIVPGPPPAPPVGHPGHPRDPRRPALEVVDVHSQKLVRKDAGGQVDLRGLPPLAAPLPSPDKLNKPFVPSTEDDATKNGLVGAGNPHPASEVTKRAADNRDIPQNAPDAAKLSTPVSAPSFSGPRPSGPNDARPSSGPGRSGPAVSGPAQSSLPRSVPGQSGPPRSQVPSFSVPARPSAPGSQRPSAPAVPSAPRSVPDRTIPDRTIPSAQPRSLPRSVVTPPPSPTATPPSRTVRPERPAPTQPPAFTPPTRTQPPAFTPPEVVPPTSTPTLVPPSLPEIPQIPSIPPAA